MIYSLLIAEPPIQVLPSLAKAVGFSEAAVFQSIHYWLSSRKHVRIIDGRYWIENVSVPLLNRFFFWEAEDIAYLIAKLEQSGILIPFTDPDTRTYHTISYGILEDMSPVDTVFTPKKPLFQKANTNMPPSFMADVQQKGDGVYSMVVQDIRHFLSCELTLEISDTAPTRSVICHFPKISDEHFRKFVWNDATLYETLLTMFHLKVGKQLLLFCIKHQALHLTIFADDAQAEDLKIYRDFLTHQDHPLPPSTERPESIIAADGETVDRWMDFMEATMIKLRQTLWRDQKTNAAIQHYLRLWGAAEF